MHPSPPLEQHPFEPFTPTNTRYVIIGTFSGWQLTQKALTELGPEDWYYGTHSRSIWHILEQVYDWPLPTAATKKELLTQLNMGITDVIASARRKKPGARDADLYDLTFQTEKLAQVLQNNSLEKLFFTSKQAQKWFNGLEGELKNTYNLLAHSLIIPQQVLPSPSPEYIRFGHDTKEGRLESYQLLPTLA